MDKNEFVFGCITGLPIAGRPAGAENEGWRDRPLFDEAESYHYEIVMGDLGEAMREELEACDGEFDASTVAAMLDRASLSMRSAMAETKTKPEIDYVIIPHSDSFGPIEVLQVENAINHIQAKGWDTDHAGLAIINPSDVGDFLASNAAHKQVHEPIEFENLNDTQLACYVIDWDDVYEEQI